MSNTPLEEQLDKILEELAESYYPEHEYNDMWRERNLELREKANLDLLSLIKEENKRARIDELTMANILNEQKELDPVINPHTPYRMRAWFKDRIAILEKQLSELGSK